MQQRALVLCMEQDAEEKEQQERNHFKMMMLAAHPNSAGEIEEMFDETYARALTPEELAAAGPLGVQEVEEALADLRQLGFSLS